MQQWHSVCRKSAPHDLPLSLVSLMPLRRATWGEPCGDSVPPLQRCDATACRKSAPRVMLLLYQSHSCFRTVTLGGSRVAAWQLCHPSHPAFSIMCTAAPAHSAHMAIVAACVQHTCSVLKYISRSRAVHATRRLLFCSSNLATSTTPTFKF